MIRNFKFLSLLTGAASNSATGLSSALLPNLKENEKIMSNIEEQFSSSHFNTIATCTYNSRKVMGPVFF
jgi:hypothetical protein